MVTETSQGKGTRATGRHINVMTSLCPGRSTDHSSFKISLVIVQKQEYKVGKDLGVKERKKHDYPIPDINNVIVLENFFL